MSNHRTYAQKDMSDFEEQQIYGIKLTIQEKK